MVYALKRLFLTFAAWALEVVDAVASRIGAEPVSDWANERWADVAHRLDGVLNGQR